MSEISEKDVCKIRQSDAITIYLGEKYHTINEDDIYCFGHIDFNDGSVDMANLDTFNWLDYLGIQGICIPANFNYENNTCVTKIDNVIQFTETFRPSRVAQFMHARMGKPHSVVIFKIDSNG